MMMIHWISAFKSQQRWLKQQSAEVEQLGFEHIPARATLSQRFRRLYPILQAFIAYLRQCAADLSPEFDSQVLIEDASLFKAQSPV
jgi:hypothetical protein